MLVYFLDIIFPKILLNLGTRTLIKLSPFHTRPGSSNISFQPMYLLGPCQVQLKAKILLHQPTLEWRGPSVCVMVGVGGFT